MPGASVTVTPYTGDQTLGRCRWFACNGDERTELEGESTMTLSSAPVCEYLVCVVETFGVSTETFAAARVDSLPTETPSAVVTTGTDEVNPYDGVISLREAFEYVLAGSTSGTTITFASDVDEVVLDSVIELENTNNSLIVVDGGSSVTLTGSSLFNVVDVNANNPVSLELKNLTMANSTDALSVSGAGAALTLTNVSSNGNVASSIRRGVINATGGAQLVIDRFNSTNDGDNGTGAIVYVEGANANVTNSLFANNRAFYAPSIALFNTGGYNATLANLTVADNVAYCNLAETNSNGGIVYKRGAGLYLEEAAGLRAYNMLFHNNSNATVSANYDFVAYGQYSAGFASMANYYYNGSYEVEKPGTFRRTNLTAAPVFGEGYAPLVGSGTIDSGSATYYGSLDLAGNPRVSGSKVDIGAYEYQQDSNALIDEAFEDYFADEFDV